MQSGYLKGAEPGSDECFYLASNVRRVVMKPCRQSRPTWCY